MPRRALGIPDRDLFREFPKKAPPFWQFAVQKHEAERAGTHFDLRLAPNRHAFSWALRKWPKPGEKALAILQPTHTRKYMTFEGVIPKGQYGAGRVSLHDQGKVRVIEYRPGMIKFVRYKGKEAEEYVLVKTKDKRWLLINTSTVPGKYKFPQWKPKYKELEFSESLADMPGIMSPKVDGAHGLVVLQAGKHPRVFSVRPPVSGGIIEWTHKMPWLYKIKVPKGINTVIRAEVFLTDKRGRALPAEMTAGVLNSSIEKAIEDQKRLGARLTIMPFAVADGKWENKPYDHHLRELERISKLVPIFRMPEIARTREEKIRLIKKINEGKHPLSREGVVIWENRPYKAKITKEIDVYPTRVFPGKGKYRDRAAGGFYYSLEPGGPEVGKVGGGLDDKLREELWKNRERIKGRVARVRFDKQMPSGALYAPRFAGWHPDKDPGDYLNPEESDKVLKMEPITKDLNMAKESLFGNLFKSSPLPPLPERLREIDQLAEKYPTPFTHGNVYIEPQKVPRKERERIKKLVRSLGFKETDPDELFDNVAYLFKEPNNKGLLFIHPENIEHLKNLYGINLNPKDIEDIEPTIVGAVYSTAAPSLIVQNIFTKLFHHLIASDEPETRKFLFNKIKEMAQKYPEDYKSVISSPEGEAFLRLAPLETKEIKELQKVYKKASDRQLRFKLGYYEKMASFGITPREATGLAKLAYFKRSLSKSKNNKANLWKRASVGKATGISIKDLVLNSLLSVYGGTLLAGLLAGRFIHKKIDKELPTVEDLQKIDTIAKYKATLDYLRQQHELKRQAQNPNALGSK